MPTPFVVAICEKNHGPRSVVRSVFCRAATNGLANADCFFSCNIRRLTFMSITDATLSGRLIAASRPAMPPTLLVQMSTFSPGATASANSRIWSDHVSKL